MSDDHEVLKNLLMTLSEKQLLVEIVLWLRSIDATISCLHNSVCDLDK